MALISVEFYKTCITPIHTQYLSQAEEKEEFLRIIFPLVKPFNDNFVISRKKSNLFLQNDNFGELFQILEKKSSEYFQYLEIPVIHHCSQTGWNGSGVT